MMPKIKQLTALRNSAILGLSSIVLSAVSLPAQAINLVQNGDLVPNQTIQNTYSNTQHRVNISSGTNSSDIPNWTFTAPGNTTDSWLNAYAVITPTGNAASKAGEAYALNLANGQTVNSPTGGSGWFVQMDGDTEHGARLTQTLTGLTAGKNYQVSFYQAAATVIGGPAFNQPTYNRIAVFFGSDFNTYQWADQINMAVSQNVTQWQKQTMTFTASAPTQYLAFLNVGGPVGQPPMALLSSVSLEEVTPPTPVPFETDALPIVGSMIAFGFGLRAKQKLAQKKLVKFE